MANLKTMTLIWPICSLKLKCVMLYSNLAAASKAKEISGAWRRNGGAALGAALAARRGGNRRLCNMWRLLSAGWCGAI
jgi:hypothetical protein